MNSNDPSSNDRVQGEGDYEAARRYDRDQREFVQSGRVDQAARDARPQNPGEAEEMTRAEDEGRSHSKGEDPQLEKPAEKPGR
jgi:hypothetical protein